MAASSPIRLMDVDMYPCTGQRSGNIVSMDDVQPPDREVRTFNLGPRPAWAWLTAGVTLLGIAEIVALSALVHALLPALVACSIDALIAVPTLALLVAIASALTGRITVDDDHLQLRVGLLGGAQVSRADIVRVERFVPSTIRPIGLGVGAPAGARQVTATLGGQAVFVRILLVRPVEMRIACWRRADADELVMGTGSPDQLIAALA
jgi:hypothetical protein